MKARDVEIKVEQIIQQVTGSAVFKEAFKVAHDVIPEVAMESLQNPGWTDDDRRNRVVQLIKQELASDYPNAGWFISVAVDFAVRSIRDDIAKLSASQKK